VFPTTISRSDKPSPVAHSRSLRPVLPVHFKQKKDIYLNNFSRWSLLPVYSCFSASLWWPFQLFLRLYVSLNELQERSATLANSASFSARNDLFPRDNEPIFEEYFGRTLDITEREWEELTVEKRNVARVAKLIIKGVMKIVDLIKGRIQQDKDVRS